MLFLLLNQIEEDAELKRIKETFKAIDVDHSGLISHDELKKALQSHLPDGVSDDHINNIINKVDYDKNGEINYSEFLSCTMDDMHLSDENLMELFKYLDIFNQTFLTKESFVKSFKRSGRNISEEDVVKMLEELNIDPSSSITFEVFKNIVKSLKN